MNRRRKWRPRADPRLYRAMLPPACWPERDRKQAEDFRRSELKLGEDFHRLAENRQLNTCSIQEVTRRLLPPMTGPNRYRPDSTYFREDRPDRRSWPRGPRIRTTEDARDIIDQASNSAVRRDGLPQNVSRRRKPLVGLKVATQENDQINILADPFAGLDSVSCCPFDALENNPANFLFASRLALFWKEAPEML